MDARQINGSTGPFGSSPKQGDFMNPAADVLGRLAVLAGQIWDEGSSNLRRLEGLQRRLREQSLNVAVLGQFKRGKSTFLNALLGEPLLPTGIVPLTAIPTFVGWGEDPLIRVTYTAGRTVEEFHASSKEEITRRLFGYVAEEANPRNRLGVSYVQLLYPATLLRDGLTLIDTPGIGSTLRHNTETALDLLPECDAALFVTSADPPITEAEVGYLAIVRDKVARVIFVLNKSDLLDEEEKRSAAQFLRRTLQSGSSSLGELPIFCLSGLRGLKAKQMGDGAALDQSALPVLEIYLQQRLVREKLAALGEAVAMKSTALLAEAAADTDLRLRALEMPLEELRRRSDTFRETLGDMEAEKRTIRDLLAGDCRRAVERLEGRAEDLRRAAQGQLMAGLQERLTEAREDRSGLPAGIGEDTEAFFSSRLRDISRDLGREIDETMDAHRRKIDALVNRVRKAAADVFEIAYMPAAASEPFGLGQDPYWVTQAWHDRLLPSPAGLLAGFLRGSARRAIVVRRLREQIIDLIDRNVENLRWAALQGIERAFRQAGAELDERLAAALQTTRGAISAAVERRQSAASEAAAELARLRQLRAQLAQLQQAQGVIAARPVPPGDA